MMHQRSIVTLRSGSLMREHEVMRVTCFFRWLKSARSWNSFVVVAIMDGVFFVVSQCDIYEIKPN